LQHGIQDPAALALLLFLSVAAFSPLSTNKWTDWLIRLTTTACVEYCPIQVIQEGTAAGSDDDSAVLLRKAQHFLLQS